MCVCVCVFPSPILLKSLGVVAPNEQGPACFGSAAAYRGQQRRKNMEPEPDHDGAAASAEEGEPPPLAEQHAFLDLAKRYDWGAVEKSLSQHPHPQAVVNAQPSGRWAALHQAAGCGSAQACEMLLRFGADPLARNGDGRTPRELAQEPAVCELLLQAEAETKQQPQPQPQQPEPQTRAAAVTFAEKPRTFSQNFAKAVEYSPMVGARSAAYDHGSDLRDVLAGLRKAASDPEAVAKYGKAGTAQQYKDLEAVLTRGLTEIEPTTSGKAPLQLMQNVMTAYSMETYFGGMGYSILNTNLREQKEYPAMAPMAQLFHHAVSTLAASDEYGHEGVAMRAMNLPEDVVSQYEVHKDTKLNVFSWSGFTSCTTDPTTCLNTFVDGYKLNTVFVIHSGGVRLRPMRIDQWSKFPHEKEVLFDVRLLWSVSFPSRSVAADDARPRCMHALFPLSSDICCAARSAVRDDEGGAHDARRRRRDAGRGGQPRPGARQGDRGRDAQGRGPLPRPGARRVQGRRAAGRGAARVRAAAGARGARVWAGERGGR
eukprot:COSAG01_NODE_11249_length_1972_cov_68.371062_1_plen_541_part_00